MDGAEGNGTAFDSVFTPDDDDAGEMFDVPWFLCNVDEEASLEVGVMRRFPPDILNLNRFLLLSRYS